MAAQGRSKFIFPPATINSSSSLMICIVLKSRRSSRSQRCRRHHPCRLRWAMAEEPINMVGKPVPRSIDYNSLKDIASYGVGVGGKRRLHGERLIAPPPSAGTGEPRLRLSTEEVMRVAGARYIRFTTEQENDDPFGGTMLSALTMEETQDVEIAHLILLAANKVGSKEYDRADRLLSCCDRSASATGNPVQMVVHHFAGALRERIELETGKKEKTTRRQVANMYKLFRPQPAIIACYRHLPFPQIMELTEVQAVLDNVASSTKIHLIDLSIRIGFNGLAACKLSPPQPSTRSNSSVSRPSEHPKTLLTKHGSG